MKIVKWMFPVFPIGYMVLIWVLSSLPDNAVVELPAASVDRFLKESLHLIEFAILYIMLVMAFLTGGHLTKKINILCALAAGFYGLADELHQYFVPSRSATVIDFVKDITGVAVAWYFVNEAYFKGRFLKLAKVLKGFQRLINGKSGPFE